MSIEYYQQHADAFFDNTIKVDVSPLMEHFLPLLPKNAHILDAGCGSGRDSKIFLDLGFKVTAIDASSFLAAKAEQYIKQPVIVTRFTDFQTEKQFDAIWACASLLHVPSQELANTFKHLSSCLAVNGVFYCSFKFGNNDVERDGRYFTNATEKRLASWIIDLPLMIEKTWITQDLRPEKQNEKWLNAILMKR